MIKVGIVGMGVIGTHIAKAIENGMPGVTLAGVSVRTPTTAGGFPAFSLETLIQRSDVIVEAATQAALREFGARVLSAGRHLMVLSVGALVGVLDEWASLAEAHGCRILVPSGAIAGLDGVGRLANRDFQFAFHQVDELIFSLVHVRRHHGSGRRLLFPDQGRAASFVAKAFEGEGSSHLYILLTLVGANYTGRQVA